MHEFHSSTEKTVEVPKKRRLTKRSVFISRLRRKILSNVWLARVIAVLIFVAVVFFAFYLIFILVKSSGWGKYFNLARNFVFTPPDVVKQLEGRTSVLILGKAGEGNTAPDLTDTMIFMSISHTNPKVVNISLPRDLWIDDLRAKLNSVYYWGNQKEDGGGLVLTKSVVEEVVGVPIHYAVIIDFEGYKKIIDEVGGVNVAVQKTFTDNLFPIPGHEDDECDGDQDYSCRYETLTFNAGRQLMNGDTALKFARSRHSEDLEEGTDIARSKRQQLVLAALKNKILSSEIIFNPNKLRSMSKLIDEYVETDLSLEQEVYLARKLYDARNSVSSFVLPEELLENPPISSEFDNLYVFVPVAKDWRDIHRWVSSILP